MLEDRSYMREPQWTATRQWATPVWLILVVANVIIYGAQEIAPTTLDKFVLVPADLARGHVWQLLTFQFLHGGLLHLIINCAMIWMFGRTLELQLGAGKFLGLYLFSGVVGGLLQCAVPWVTGNVLGLGIGVVGASAGIFGLITAFALLHWEEEITLLLMFIIPVRMRAKWMLLVLAVIGGLGMLDSSSNIGHAAHLGGMLGALWFAAQFVPQAQWAGPMWLTKLRIGWPRRDAMEDDKIIQAPRVRISLSPRSKHSAETMDATVAGAEDYISREVDPILEKISKSGIESLTNQEREILQRARRQMDR
ncbi:MAG: rhomboid family intramembrane serine protease [Pedosphaera sp.]|nr:rhomboid family intramembrane serine protease [Pedosphaera sp.]